jgi:hypothetical protein
VTAIAADETTIAPTYQAVIPRYSGRSVTSRRRTAYHCHVISARNKA